MSNQIELSWTAPQNFFMVVEQLPDLQFTVQQVIIPTVTGDVVPLDNRYNPGKTFIPGEGIDYSELSLTFLIDKEMLTYQAILRWLKANTQPEGLDRETLAGWAKHGSSELSTGFAYSNITIFATDAGGTPVAHWNFVNAFPSSVDGPAYDSTLPDVTYLTATCSFQYHYFQFATYKNGSIDKEII